VGYAGKVQKVTLPKLTRKMEEYQAGGLDAPIEIDMGMEKIIIDELILAEMVDDVITSFGTSKIDGVSVRLTGSIKAEDQEEEIPVKVTMQGRWSEIDMGSFESGKPGEMKLKAALVYYKLEKDGKELIEIDLLNGVSKVNGKDLLAKRRANLGL
jgi:P2 family phage contractile tail tube protein